MTSKEEFLETLKTEILEWGEQLALEYGISKEDALEVVKSIIREKVENHKSSGPECTK